MCFSVIFSLVSFCFSCVTEVCLFCAAAFTVLLTCEYFYLFIFLNRWQMFSSASKGMWKRARIEIKFESFLVCFSLLLWFGLHGKNATIIFFFFLYLFFVFLKGFLGVRSSRETWENWILSLAPHLLLRLTARLWIMTFISRPETCFLHVCSSRAFQASKI